MEIFVGKQPILDMNGNLFSFELLYRNSAKNTFPDINPELATIGVIVNTYLAPGFEQITATKTFVNFSSSLLSTDIFDSLIPEDIVIEILEDIEITPALLSKLKKLKESGFQLALDDFVLNEHHIECHQLFQLIDYIKVDFIATTLSQRTEIEELKHKFPHITLLAEKVETEEEFEEAKGLGYGLFQGYFFAKPEVLKSEKLPSETLLYFEVIKLLNKKEPNIDEIATVIMRDISLTYKLLKYLNSYIITPANTVVSIKQAIVLMGLQEFKSWMQYLMIYQLGADNENGWHKALVHYSLERAKMCEMLAAKSGKTDTDPYYVLGLFSLIDRLLKREPADVFPLLPTSLEIIHTLLGRKTEMTPYLQLAKAHERQDLVAATELAERLGIKW